ncbi:MAG: hypothetical protein OEY00_02065 [Gammaproteobacteria bacterium]|nr:hypothetical protein [Gammaproteobacteria bacterium]
MKLWIVIVATFGLVGFGMMSLPVAAIAYDLTSRHRGRKFTVIQDRLHIGFSFLLPAVCLTALVLIWYAYIKDLNSMHYWWIALPVPFFTLYFIFITGFEKKWW